MNTNTRKCILIKKKKPTQTATYPAASGIWVTLPRVAVTLTGFTRPEISSVSTAGVAHITVLEGGDLLIET